MKYDAVCRDGAGFLCYLESVPIGFGVCFLGLSRDVGNGKSDSALIFSRVS